MVRMPIPRARSAAALLLPVGQLLDDPVGPRERRVERLVRGHVGDLVVEQAAVDTRRHCGHQPRPDDRTIGLVEVAADLADPDRRGTWVVLVGQGGQPARPDHGRPPRHRGQSARPQRGFLDLAAVADPLGFDAVGEQGVGDAGRDLDAGVASQQPLDERPRRRPLLDVEGAAAAAAAGGVGEGDVERRGVDLRRVGLLDRAGELERRELARATATRTGSRSTPAVVIPARANATRSPPMPQPRSMTLWVTAACNRPARWVATECLVACSSPSWVKYIRSASSPNFGTARRRRSACPIAVATRSAVVVRRSWAWTASSSYPS